MLNKFFDEVKENWFTKKDVIYLILNLAFGLVIYMLVMSENLYNIHDSLWVGPYFYASENEYECGRWLWPIIDKLLQGYKDEPLITSLSLLIFSLGNTIVVKQLKIKNNFVKYLFGFCTIASTSMLIMLTFKHQSYMFALSYLFAVLASYCILTFSNKYLSIIISSIFLILSLASYQSQIGCFCLVILIYIVSKLINNEQDNYRDLILLLIKFVVVIIISCLLYKVIWDVMLKINGLTITDYKNASSLSVIGIILNLPKNFIYAYSYFFDYYNGLFKVNAYPFVAKLLLIVSTAIIVLSMIKHRRKLSDILFAIVLIVLIPAASNFSCLFLDAGFALQQSFPVTLAIPLLVYISIYVLIDKDVIHYFYKFVVICLSTLFLLGNVLSTEIDVEAMKEGKESTVNLVNNVINTLMENGQYDSNNKYYFIGSPSNNESFYVTELWTLANVYAQFGNFNSGLYTPSCYQGVVSYYIGNSLVCSYSSNNAYGEFMESDVVKQMPCYPSEGSIKEINGYTIIKISDVE